MHLGNVWCALAAWLAVRSQGGTLVLRIEDLDKRKIPDWTESALIDDLRWLGLDWDGAPIAKASVPTCLPHGSGGSTDAGLTYPCFCTRAELHAAGGTPRQ